MMTVVMIGWSCSAQSAPSDPTVAFFYADNPPLLDLQAFDIAVVDPDHVSHPERHARRAEDGSHELFAYVALGEVQPSRAYYKDLPKGALRTDNPDWGSKVIDQAAPGWSEFFLSRVIAPLWQQGWRGFFLDTLDSYQLFAKTDAERKQQRDAMIETLREFKRRYPEAKLMLNRGFELLPEIAPLTMAVAAESLYQGFDAAKNQYRPVPSADHDWLLAQMRIAHERYRLPVISIEYVAPGSDQARELARTTAAQVRADGFVPWVADGALGSIGIGSIELLPRTVLILVDNLDLDFHYTEAQRFLGMPLNYLGLRYEFVDLTKQPLPDAILRGRYAGVVSWLNAGVSHPALGAWFAQRIAEGVPIAVFENFGFSIDSGNAAGLGLRAFAAPKPEQLSIRTRDAAMFNFEAEPIPDRSALLPLSLLEQRGRSLLQMQDNLGNRYDAAGLTEWGGFVLAPFTVRSLPALGDNRWILQPIKFLQAALRLPVLPVPDVTTEGGRRILMAHIDADGFASRAEMPGAPLASEVLQREILSRYRIPTAVSVIEGEVSAQGIYPKLSSQLELIARRIFALPYVEAASHTYSHPFNWAKAMQQATTQTEDQASGTTYGLPLPGYQFSLKREVQGSVDYINTRLLSTHKKVALFLWSGNCVPPAAAIAETYDDGVLNMNGGDTGITDSNKSWTAIAAQGVRKNGWYQVFAPNQNENVYTHNWTGPFYGYERVLQTFQLTGAPYRFKPVDIYYHVYSASKPASLAALRKVYDWAAAQPFTTVFPSQYAQKVLDFEATTIARELGSGDLLVRTGPSLRTLRLPTSAVLPSVAASTGLAGFTGGPNAQYLTLAAAQVRLSASSDQHESATVQEVNGSVSALRRSRSGSAQQTEFVVTGNQRIVLTMAHTGTCSLQAGGKTILPASGTQRYAFGESGAVVQGSVVQSHNVTVRCPSW